MLSNFTNSGQSRSIIFPEGPKADGWFLIGKMLKEFLIEANMQDCSPLGPKESVSCSQMNFREEARFVVGDKQTVSHSSADCVSVSPGLFNFHVLRKLRETYPFSDCDLDSCNREGSTSVVPESPSKVSTPTLLSPQKKSKEITVHTRRRNRDNCYAVPNSGLDNASTKDQGTALPLASLRGRCGPSTSRTGCVDNLGEGSVWVLNHILEFCEKLGLKVGGNVNEVFDFLAALEVARKNSAQGVVEVEDMEGSGEKSVLHGGKH